MWQNRKWFTSYQSTYDGIVLIENNHAYKIMECGTIISSCMMKLEEFWWMWDMLQICKNTLSLLVY